MSNILENIKKLMGSENTDDQKIAMDLIENGDLSMNDRKELIEDFIAKNPDAFRESEIKLLRSWIGFSDEKDSKPFDVLFKMKNYNTWISKKV